MKIKTKFLIAILSLVIASPSALSGDLAGAENFEENFPYTKTFILSAYYSPLPCQEKYVTGSYSGDIRLNGSGVNSADGTPVYAGMIAAPRTYAFGTKMYIPGVGIAAVHDRGGAIVSAGNRGHEHDRLDIWMGYGDKGLTRALNWGKRTLDVTVYGINDAILEQITLTGYSNDEAVPNECIYSIDALSPTTPMNVVEVKDLSIDLKYGNRGPAVYALQGELKKLNFFKEDTTGFYGELTEHAVFKFQQSQSLVGNEDSPGAGVFGPKTRDRMQEITASRAYTQVLVAQATEKYNDKHDRFFVKNELDFGMVSSEVKILQKFLKAQGFFESPLITNYYGPQTREAVLRYQLANGLISDPNDTGAGRVGPETLNAINSYS